MAARAMWKAELVVGTRAIPIKLYSAVEDRTVHFRMLEAKTRTPVEQQMFDPTTEQPVPDGVTQKGVQVDEGMFVTLNAEDLASLEPPESRSIGIERYVPTSAISDNWYERPYWLAPDGDDQAYFALVKALKDEDRIGIAHWVMRKHRYHGALRVSGKHLMLVRMRHAEEVVPASALTAPSGREADPREVALAEQLLAALEGPFEPKELANTYDERVRELVEAKAAGKLVTLAPPVKRQAQEGSLASALEASLKRVGGSRG